MYKISGFTYSNLILPHSQPGNYRRFKRRQNKSVLYGAGKRQIWIVTICLTHRHQGSRQMLMMTTIFPKKTCPQRILFPMRFPGKTVPAEKEINLSPGFSRFGEDFGLYRKPKKRIIKTMVRRVWHKKQAEVNGGRTSASLVRRRKAAG